MKALGAKRPDEAANNAKKPRVGANPGPSARSQAQNPPVPENFDENIKL